MSFDATAILYLTSRATPSTICSGTSASRPEATARTNDSWRSTAPGKVARDAVRHFRDLLRLLGRLQAVPLPAALHGRGALRRLDRAAPLQRVGAALPVRPRRNFYYTDYRVGGGMKVYNWDTFTCCSGTYIQNLAEYHNLIYFKDPRALREPLFRRRSSGTAAGATSPRQETPYPETGPSLTLKRREPAPFAFHFRVPAWTRSCRSPINRAGRASRRSRGRGRRSTEPGPGTRRGPDSADDADGSGGPRASGSRRRVRGPVVFALEGAYHDRDSGFRTDDELATWLVAEPGGTPPRGEWATRGQSPRRPTPPTSASSRRTRRRCGCAVPSRSTR